MESSFKTCRGKCPAGKSQTHSVECFRSNNPASASKQASAHFNPCLHYARMLPCIVQQVFLQRKGSKTQDKSFTNGESFEKAKHHSRSCSEIWGACPSCRLRSTLSSSVTASRPYTASLSWPNTDHCGCVSSQVLPMLWASPSCTQGSASALLVRTGWRL